MKNNKLSVHNSQDLLKELQSLGSEASKLIGDTAGEQTDQAIAALKEQFEATQARFSDLYGQAKEKAIEGAKYTDEVVRDSPYQSIAIVAGVALVAGLLIGRATKN